MWRYRCILLSLTLGFLLVLSRLFYWQVVRADELSNWGTSQYGKITKLTPRRGEIKTSDGFPIATNKITYLLFANPKAMSFSDKEKNISLLTSLLNIPIASVSSSLSKDLFWVPIKSGLDINMKTKIEDMKLPGIDFEEQPARFYPEGSMSAQLIGFVGKDDNGDNKGYFGIEGYYDRQLKGKAGISTQIHDALGRPIVAKLGKDSAKIDGRNLTLHIDRAIQFMVEQKLNKAVTKYGASGGMVIVMNPRNGAVLAMSSFPSFDQREFKEYDSSLYKNPIVSNVYEPGSTFKALVMAAGIDAKVVKPDTKCPVCSGPVSIGGYEIRTWNSKYYKDITMTDVIMHSDNTGMVYVGKSLGLDNLLSYLDKFGIGSTTGIDLQGEVPAELRSRDSWYPIDAATVTFGQGISVTPIMLLDAFSAIANDGKRMEPHVVAKIETDSGEVITIPPRELGRPITPSTAKIMTEILVNAVNKGEAKWTKVKGYRIAGKTGTAQIPIAGHYDPNKTIASFIGFAPADDPKFSMLVIIDRPTSSIYGSETAAPLFFDIARDLFSYYTIPPTE